MTTEVFDAAVSVARAVGYRNVTRRLIAEQMAASSKSSYSGQVDQALNHLINDGSVSDILRKLLDAKDRLALVPGRRSKTAQAGFWKPYDRADLLDCAYRMATRDGLFAINPTGVAREAGFSRGTLLNYFGSFEGLLDEVVALAIKHGNLKLCAQAIAAGRASAADIPDELKKQALKSLA